MARARVLAMLTSDVIFHRGNSVMSDVILNVGLGISLYDISSMGDSYIFPGDGASHTCVTFRYVVFRPFIEEVIDGTVKASTADGIQVSLGFFDDIYIEADAMMSDSHFDETEQVWVWDFLTGDGEVSPLFIEIGGKIRVKIIGEKFTDTTPSLGEGAKGEQGVEGAEAVNGTSTEMPTESELKKISPYVVHATIKDQGLGLLSWWNNQEVEDEIEETVEES